MAVQRKVFRIEESAGASRPAAAIDEAQRHQQFMTELQALRTLIAPPAPDRSIMERARAQIAEAQAYKSELDLIHAAVKRTQDEIGTPGVAANAKASRAERELVVTVEGLDRATETILRAAEEIDRSAIALARSPAGEDDKVLARGIQTGVVQIFEACAAQDIAGQRVTNVIAALRQVQDHIARLQAIWQGIERFEPITFAAEGEDCLLNGPRLPEDDGHSSQDDIDGMFGCA